MIRSVKSLEGFVVGAWGIRYAVVDTRTRLSRQVLPGRDEVTIYT
jgi:hypothetical protein